MQNKRGVVGKVNLAAFTTLAYNEFMGEEIHGKSVETESDPVETKSKLVEKYYIEVTPSASKRFIIGLIGGIGWGVGLTLGTGAVLTVLGFFAAKIDFVPILGQFLSEIIKSAQHNLNTR